MKRNQINQERIIALLNLLVAEGLITEKEAELLRNCDNYNEPIELSYGLVRRRNNQ